MSPLALLPRQIGDSLTYLDSDLTISVVKELSIYKNAIGSLSGKLICKEIP
jgi:hypothetical protein